MKKLFYRMKKKTYFYFLLMQSYGDFGLIPRNIANSSLTCVDNDPNFGQIGETGQKVVQTIFYFVKSWRVFRDLKHSPINFAADKFIV